MSKSKKLNVQGNEITIIENKGKEYISLTDMLKAKDGDFFISDWLRNRNTVEYLGIWESVYNPSFNYGEFATIKINSRSCDQTTKLSSNCGGSSSALAQNCEFTGCWSVRRVSRDS